MKPHLSVKIDSGTGIIIVPMMVKFEALYLPAPPSAEVGRFINRSGSEEFCFYLVCPWTQQGMIMMVSSHYSGRTQKNTLCGALKMFLAFKLNI